jgi:ribosomal protein S18 acetylase RimI-like enzyme
LAPVAIRRLTASDWQLFREIRLKALREAPYAFGTTAADAERLGEAEWRRRLTARAAFAAMQGGLAIGLAAGIATDSTEEAELVSTWVDPSRRGRGIGAQLVDAVVGWAIDRRFKRLRLWVAADNDTAERLYARLGFVRTGEVQPMGKQGSGAIEFAMVRQLG